ncbi:hypothetical protein L226DRAFT_574777 [Lentinus tigrinus ALCF2SS1-7]|nr:hypothetical protein L226DRAFT_574777 [Lentinus tigrinus ALCF2SS1-7]
MGEFVTDLDDSYIKEDLIDDVLPPPKGPHIACQRRIIVALPQRLQNSVVNEAKEGGVQPITTQSTPSFGFSIPAPCDKILRRSTFQERRCSRSRSIHEGSDKLRTRYEHPNRRARPASTTLFQEVFHSITATPGLDERSFEEFRLECYSMSVAITGAIPPPVPPTRDEHSAGHVKVFPPYFASYTTLCSKDENAECCDYDMSSDIISSEFTFTPDEPLSLETKSVPIGEIVSFEHHEYRSAM